MTEVPSPILIDAIALPLCAAFVAARTRNVVRARAVAITASVVTLILLLEVLRFVLTAGPSRGTWLMADGLNAVPMVLIAALSLVTLIAAPKRDMERGFLVSVLVVTSSTIAAYAAANLLLFLAAWIVPLLPFAFRTGRGPRFVYLASGILLSVAVVLLGVAGASLSMTGLPATIGDDGLWAFGLLVIAAMVREFIFPFHRGAVALFEDGGRMSIASLLVNSHLGAFLIARVVMPSFPGVAEAALPWVGGLALFTSLYTAVLGIAEREPRRILAMLMISQSSAIVAGLATSSHEGIAGALVQWIVLGVSSTVLITVYRSLEVRVDQNFGGTGFLGLATSMPRLAVFFAISGLTMVGLPGTLGFAGEDLLLHGVLAGYSWWGAALPVAIALNAFHAFRLFAHLFLGKDDVTRNSAFDALPRERWVLSACLALLVWGGLVPHRVVSLQAAAVGSLARTSGSGADSHP